MSLAAREEAGPARVPPAIPIAACPRMVPADSAVDEKRVARNRQGAWCLGVMLLGIGALANGRWARHGRRA